MTVCISSRVFRAAVASAVVLLAIIGCKSSTKEDSGSVSAKHVRTVKGFDVLESVLAAPDGKTVYVSNVQDTGRGPWASDGEAFISRLKPDGKIVALKWLKSEPDAVMNSPKGMCMLEDVLYVADMTRVLRIGVVEDGSPQWRKPIDVDGARMLNDTATDGRAVYVSDTGTGKVHRIDPESGRQTLVKAPVGVNGITFHGGKMYGVSWPKHDVYELDATGKKGPEAFGLGEHFESLDGIEVMSDGTFVVADFSGGKVCAISPDKTTVTTLIDDLTTPADIGLDRRNNVLYVPMFKDKEVGVYKLKKN